MAGQPQPATHRGIDVSALWPYAAVYRVRQPEGGGAARAGDRWSGVAGDRCPLRSGGPGLRAGVWVLVRARVLVAA